MSERPSQRRVRIAIIGNPNCGKTCVFNNLTGAHQHVGNWPGVTVELKRGEFSRAGVVYEVIDLPGTYTLSSYSSEEKVVETFLARTPPDVLINVVDATNLERHLVLTAQLLEQRVTMLLALNMMDEARAHDLRIDSPAMAARLGMPVIPLVARRNEGTPALLAALEEAAATPRALASIKQVGRAARAPAVPSDTAHMDAWHAFARATVQACVRHGAAAPVGAGKAARGAASRRTEVLDSILTRPVLGLLLFGVCLWLTFQAVFMLGQPLVAGLERLFDLLAEAVRAHVPAGELRSLLADGVVKGVGGVLMFVPNIMLLFLAIGVLEESGYMARAAFVTDRLMQALRLHGTAFIPMLIGFGCNVPAIMATRTLGTKRERVITALIIPFMSCSARLPVYGLFISAFFPARQGALVLFSLSFLGIIVAVLSANLLGAAWFGAETAPLLMELPPYRLPTLRSVVLLMWTRAWLYLKKAGTVLLAASIAMWFLCTHPQPAGGGTTGTYAQQLGVLIAPALRPLGFNEKISVALLSGFMAKEAVVSTLTVIYGVDRAEPGHLQEHLRNDPAFAGGPLEAYTLMVFVLLYAPCLGVATVLWKEFSGWGALFMLVYTTAVAWGAAFLIRWIGLAVGRLF